MIVREAQPEDRDAIIQVLRDAFDTDSEADLVTRLLKSGIPTLALVAEKNNSIVGYLLFTPVNIQGIDKGPELLGLAPMAVRPEFQKQGVGSALIHAGIAIARNRRYQAVVVLGHPDYYARFGFLPASKFGLNSEYNVPDDAFMVLELVAGALSDIQGTVKYHPLFQET